MNRITSLSLQVVKEKNVLYETNKISSPSNIVEILRLFELDKQSEENLIMLALDTKNKVLGYFTISIGTLNSSLVSPREIFKRAMLVNANSIILAHNHPSGDCTPSREDIEATKRIKECGKILGIELLDHIIIGDYGNYKSLRETGDF